MFMQKSSPQNKKKIKVLTNEVTMNFFLLILFILSIIVFLFLMLIEIMSACLKELVDETHDTTLVIVKNSIK